MRKVLAIFSSVLIVFSLSGCRDSTDDIAKPAESTTIAEVPHTTTTATPAHAIGWVSPPIEESCYRTVFSTNRTPCAEGVDVVIPITSVPVGMALDTIVYCDDTTVHVSTLVDSSGNIVVWYGVCASCNWLPLLSHELVEVDGARGVYCSRCGRIYDIEDLMTGNSSESDACAPYVLTEDRYQLKKVSECDINLDTYQWMDQSREFNEDWGTTQVELSTISGDDAVVISYTEMHNDIEMFEMWRQQSLGAVSGYEE